MFFLIFVSISCFYFYVIVAVNCVILYVGMHDIYRTDKWSTDMCENDVIFIAPINKWNPISRSDKVRMLVNQSISLIYLSFKLQWLSACVALITS